MGIVAVGGSRGSWHCPTQWAVDNTNAHGFGLLGPASRVPSTPAFWPSRHFVTSAELASPGPEALTTDPWPRHRLRSGSVASLGPFSLFPLGYLEYLREWAAPLPSSLGHHVSVSHSHRVANAYSIISTKVMGGWGLQSRHGASLGQ